MQSNETQQQSQDSSTKRSPISRWRLTSSPWVPPALLAAMSFMGTGIMVTELRLLDRLNIRYNPLLNYTHIMIPVGCAIVWLSTMRRWPVFSQILAIVLCGCLMPLVPAYAQSLTVRLPISRWLEPTEMQSLQRELPFPITESGSSGGDCIIVAPQNAEVTRNVLKRMNVFVPS